MRRNESSNSIVANRARPTAARAAAAARLAGAPAGRADVADRMRSAARRSAAGSVAGRPVAGRPAAARPSAAAGRPVAGRPAAGRPAAGRPAAGRPVAGRPAAGPPPSERSAPPPTRDQLGGNPPRRQSSEATVLAARLARTAGNAALALAPQKRTDAKESEPKGRHLRVVRDPGLSAAQRRRRARAALVVSIAGATMIGLTLVYLHVVLAQRQFTIDHMNSEISQAQATYQASRLQVAQLSAPAHIIAQAEGQLGMVQPDKVQYLTPSAGSTQTQAQTRPIGQETSKVTLPASGAPAGEANWPVVKSQLAGQP